MEVMLLELAAYPQLLHALALLGVAAGRIGAIKSLEQLKGVCSHIGAIVVPGSVLVAGVQKVFDAQGQCTDAETETLLRGLAHALLSFLKEYVCPKHVLEEMVRSDAAPWSTNV
jgi:NAD(P)H-dependent FMN reductase